MLHAPGLTDCSYIELSRSALRTNLRFIERLVGRGTTLCSVIKGNAYGHGIETFVPLAESCGVRCFAVFSAAEAKVAHSVSTCGSRIQIMGYATADEIEWAVSQGVELWVHDRGRLELALGAARRVGRPAVLHLELETGMHRTGLDPADLDVVVDQLVANADVLQPRGVCTHLAGAESSANFLRIGRQLDIFDKTVARLSAAGLGPLERHVASSAAALIYDRMRLDLVRVGIAQYGFWPSLEIKMHRMVAFQQDSSARWVDPLKRVISWKSRVMTLKRVSAGQFIGYGNAHQATRLTTVAVIPVGYAHGFTRSLSNTGRVLVRGRPAPVVGLVGMNLMSVDVTDIPGVAHDDEVVLIGKQGRHSISVASFSDMTPFLNYEALARLPRDIPRIVTA